MICAKCGKHNDEDTRFCIECGANLVEQQQAVTAPAQLLDTNTRQARLEDFEITQDASSTAPLSPISGPNDPAVPTAPSFKPTSRLGQGNQRTTDAGVHAPASAYYAGRQVPGQNNPLHAQPAMANNYPGTQMPPISRTPNSTTKDGKTPYIIIAAIAGAAFLLCLAAFITYSMGLWGARSPSSSNAPSASSSVTPSSTSPSSSASHTAIGFDTNGLNAIVNGVSTTDVAVAATVDGNTAASAGENTYSSQQADKQFVAAGLYLPIYLQARAQNNASALTSATAMMQNMDNSAGNDAIAALGGLDAVSQWSAQQGYAQTSFSRDLGDVQASAAGYENRSSASDASRMLSAAQNEGATELMNYDLASDGVSIPAGVSVNAHRGMGIQNTYNYFITMSKGSTSISLAVMTQSQGKERTAQMTSALLSSMANSFDMK
ncbi:MAG: serine hydrolase [Bifidobacterium crudilactis]|uniref:serine hydrolase n=1 Tax=Bifidobacterium crudilactis TaxID=327277 RepID=UPI003F9AF5A0